MLASVTGSAGLIGSKTWRYDLRGVLQEFRAACLHA